MPSNVNNHCYLLVCANETVWVVTCALGSIAEKNHTGVSVARTFSRRAEREREVGNDLFIVVPSLALVTHTFECNDLFTAFFTAHRMPHESQTARELTADKEKEFHRCELDTSRPHRIVRFIGDRDCRLWSSMKWWESRELLTWIISLPKGWKNLHLVWKLKGNELRSYFRCRVNFLARILPRGQVEKSYFIHRPRNHKITRSN